MGPAEGLLQKIVERLGNQPTGLPDAFRDIDDRKKTPSVGWSADLLPAEQRQKTSSGPCLGLPDGNDNFDLDGYPAG